MAVAGIAGRGVAFLYITSGSSTPRRKEHSRAEALAVRGENEAAIVAFQNAILDAPEEGEAYLSIARIYRDEVNKPEEALAPGQENGRRRSWPGSRRRWPGKIDFSLHLSPFPICLCSGERSRECPGRLSECTRAPSVGETGSPIPVSLIFGG